MGFFRRKRKERRTHSTYSNSIMANDHNLSVAMFVAAQPDAWVDPDEQQRDADEAYDREHPVDEIEDARSEQPVEDKHEAQQEAAQESYESSTDSSDYSSSDYSSSDSSSYDSSSYSYDSGSSYSYDSGSSSYDSGSSYSDSGSSF